MYEQEQDLAPYYPSVPGHRKTKGKPLSQSPRRRSSSWTPGSEQDHSPEQNRTGQGTHTSPADHVSQHGTMGTLRCLF